MSIPKTDSQATDSSEQARLLAVELGDWPGLEQPVQMDLDPRTTVLVGKNGAGKSLLMEGIHRAARLATDGWRMKSHQAPRFFRCSVESPDLGVFGYEVRVGTLADVDATASSTLKDTWAATRAMYRDLPSLSERCFTLPDNWEL